MHTAVSSRRRFVFDLRGQCIYNEYAYGQRRAG